MTSNRSVITIGTEPLVLVSDWFGARQDSLNGPASGGIGVACSADGDRVAYLTRDGGVHCWRRTPSGPPIRLAGVEDAVTVAVTPDGEQVIAGDFQGGIWAWTLDGPTMPLPITGHDDTPVRSFAVTPDCKLLVSGAEDGTVRISDLRPGRTPSPPPELRSDEPSEQDLLGFTDDVHGLARLITDRETEPPLAIALLGRWGSGKSSFLRQLENRIAALAKQGRNNSARSVYSTAVRQVRFDAWHYNDDHLWVGIVEHLFANLAEPEGPDTDEVQSERTALRNRLGNLEELAAPNTPPLRRIRARIRLWLGNLARWRGRLAWAGAAVLGFGSAAGVLWWLSHGAALTWFLQVMTWLCGAVATIASWPILERAIVAWTTDRELGARRSSRLDRAVRDTRMRLARLDTAQQLALAIEQARDARYDQYRGLLGQVHADLRELSETARQAFAEWDQADPVKRAQAAGEPPIERVILYIDDLDRCSPRKVVDVLAAVHLLLALPLFVVVVAVDPRWLRRCLEQYYTELFGTYDGAEVATPLDYLDKVFQVVFSLRPMGGTAERFVAQLARPEVPAHREPIQEPDQGNPDSPDRTIGGQDVDGSGDVVVSGPDPQPQPLVLGRHEREFIQRLRPLLETPRAVKRFVNLYRLVRATIADERLDEFIGNGIGPYRAVLLLLAVLVSAPDAGRQLIAALCAPGENARTIAELLDRLDNTEQSTRTNEFWTRLRQVTRDEEQIVDSIAICRRWAGTIARFSFETWDLTEPG